MAAVTSCENTLYPFKTIILFQSSVVFEIYNFASLFATKTHLNEDSNLRQCLGENKHQRNDCCQTHKLFHLLKLHLIETTDG